jgi:hypothetical protein
MNCTTIHGCTVLYQVVTSVDMSQQLCTGTVAWFTSSGLGQRKMYELHINSIIFYKIITAVIQLPEEFHMVMTVSLYTFNKYLQQKVLQNS